MEIILAQPRGFCAGVERAITIVEKSLEKFGPPIYVRHEIVHNKYVVESLTKKGVIFVDEVDDVPEGSVLIFSAHGVSQKVENDAEARHLDVIDATCPLVTKVHKEAISNEREGNELILIGHEGHPEVEGTAGRVKQKVHIVSSISDIDKLNFLDQNKIAYVTQTTLSVDDTKQIIAKLKEKFPAIKGPDTKDICYATQNRQNAVRELAKITEIILVVGSENSSNSNRLKDLAIESGVESYLIDSVENIDLKWLDGKKKIGITSGASAPELLTEQLINYLQSTFNAKVTKMDGVVENIKFKLPKKLIESL
ncbi:4-hydroxy-3-methylbut-2-enyl diphosphate reductase [Candidatus Arcanobacter lacustris]|uniref:4-hydroxy-3-methylbut-2-enyl diphosphate reductase n=1 Tax=Candidatus Arcanibacter lacustris TaxID=1607817 RepID=A0A0F5MPT0_9RICK|nr:4-hydroxy-3-methylbut-2-enyl diphosphate reductase [Candidatus Arcanobacter lacustris]